MGVQICAWCGSGDTAALADRVSCLKCGKQTGYGNYNDVGPQYEQPGPEGKAEIRPQSADDVLEEA